MNDRVNHLFGLGMAYVSNNAKLSRFYMIKGFEVAEKYGCRVPDAVLSRTCKKCRCIQIPSKNCKVRVRTRSSRSPINRKRKKKSSSEKNLPMLRNEIVSACAMCGFETRLRNNKKKKNSSTKRKRDEDTTISKSLSRSKGMQQANKKKKKKKKRDDRTQNSTKTSSSLLNFLENFTT